MKRKNITPRRWISGLRRLALGTALLVAGNAALNCLGQNSPVGQTWDCLISGPREGIAYLNFFPDFTFTGYEVLVPKAAKKNSSSSSNSRDNTGDRGDSGSSSTITPGPQIFGYIDFHGRWGYDVKGKVIGSFAEVSTLENCTTNAVAIGTNYVDGSYYGYHDPNEYTGPADINGSTIYYINDIQCTALTNAISFSAKVQGDKRLTLVCSTSFGKVNYRGVAAKNLSDISGQWYGERQQDNQSYVEFLSLTRVDPNKNIYNVYGTGPGYTYGYSLPAFVLLSTQKMFALAGGIDPDGTVVRAVIGPFNAQKMSTKTHGWQQPSGLFTNPMRFDATFQPPALTP